MTAAAGLKRLGLAIVAAVAALLAIVIGAPLLISADGVREAIKNDIRAVTGLDPVMRGESRVSLFPSGSISFDDVMLGDPGRPALSAERLTARLRLLPLLFGRAEIADVLLVRPTIAVTFEPSGRSNWSNLIETLARTLKPAAQRSAAFSEIRIDRGTVLLRDDARHLHETLAGVEISLAWPSISKSFGATGRFLWREKPVDLSLNLSDFAAALAGDRSGLKLRLAGAPLKVAFDGAMAVRPTLKVQGTLAADSASLREALLWSGLRPLPGGGLGRFALKAQTNLVGGTIALSNVNVELDGNAAEGVLTFATDGRQTLQGTLAADELDLTPYLSTVRLLTSNQRDWSTREISADGLNGIDLDLRLSAAKVVASNAKLGRTAIAANLRGGHLTITIGESNAYGGMIQGAISFAGSPLGVDVKAQMQFSDVDLETCLSQLFGLRRLEGKGNISFAVEGSGTSVLGVTRTLDGSANLVGREGALAGINVEQLLRRLERRPLSGGGEFRSGRTPYDRISIALKIAQGTVTVEDVNIEGSALHLALNGSASIPSRELDLKGIASLMAGGGQTTRAFELPFVVQGSWDDPIMLPDPQILIHRSGAAAPLLNAVRDGRARDAVRSVIERLTGAPPAGVDPTARPGPAQ